MDYPSRKRRPRRKKAAGSGDGADRLELELAEFSAPSGEEMPWRAAESEWTEPGDPWREWRLERGPLH